MKLRPILVYVILALLACRSTSASEAVSLAEVKTIFLRFGETPSVTDTILTEIESRLSNIGVTVTGNEADADAEMVITGSDASSWSIGVFGGGSRHQVQAAVRVLSLPSKRVLFSATGGAANDELDDACRKTAKDIVKKFVGRRKG